MVKMSGDMTDTLLGLFCGVILVWVLIGLYGAFTGKW